MKRFVSLLLCLALIMGLSVAIAETWLCPNCGKASDGNFCPWCGEKKPPVKVVCPRCKSSYDLEVGYAFCMECGTSLTPVGGEIRDSWEDILAAIDDGIVQRCYAVGAYKPLDFGKFGTVNMQIAGFDLDERADGQGKAATTWIAMEQLSETHRMNPKLEEGKEGTGMLGGWEKTELRQWLNDEVFPAMSSNIRNRLIVVKKMQRGYNLLSDEEWQVNEDRIWIPSHDEIFGTTALYYGLFFGLNKNRVREQNGSAAWWWLRSANNFISAHTVISNGSNNYTGVNNSSGGIVIGFCL